MLITPFISAIFAFSVTLLFLPWWIKYLWRINLVVKDKNKQGEPLVPISGGVIVLCGTLAGLMLFVFFRTFFSHSGTGLILDGASFAQLFATIVTIFIITLIGFIDDLFIYKSKERSAGLHQWQKPLLTLAAAVPLMAINAGTKTMLLPFFGHVNFGSFYPLLFVPLGVVGASNMVNMWGGFNGLESGLGLIYTFSLGLYAYYHHRYIAALIALMVFASLLAFYFYNKFPAKILAGDSLTYLLGAVLASIAIVGNLEKAALIISIPFIIELILKLRGNLKKQSYGCFKNGTVHSLYPKIYSLPHFFTRTGKFTEPQIVFFMYLIEAIFAGLIWIV